MAARVFFLASDLAWCLKADVEECPVTLLALANVFYRVDMKRDSETTNGQDNCQRFSIDENLKETSSAPAPPFHQRQEDERVG